LTQNHLIPANLGFASGLYKVVEPELFVTRYYVLRALRLRAAGVAARKIEECTGIPQLQLARLPPSVAKESSSPSHLDELASRLTKVDPSVKTLFWSI
jgi:hypothetical protein